MMQEFWPLTYILLLGAFMITTVIIYRQRRSSRRPYRIPIV